MDSLLIIPFLFFAQSDTLPIEQIEQKQIIDSVINMDMLQQRLIKIENYIKEKRGRKQPK